MEVLKDIGEQLVILLLKKFYGGQKDFFELRLTELKLEKKDLNLQMDFFHFIKF